MPRSIANTPNQRTGNTADVIGSVLEAFAQAKETQRLEGVEKQRNQQNNLTKFIEKVSTLPEDEQADMIELMSRRADLEDFLGVTIEGLNQLTTPSTTIAGSTQQPPSSLFPGGVATPRRVLTPGESIETQRATGVAEQAKAVATQQKVAARAALRGEKVSARTELIAAMEAFANADGSKISLADAKAMRAGTISDEKLRTIRSTTKLDQSRQMARNIAPLVGLQPADLDKMIVQMAASTPALLSTFELAAAQEDFNQMDVMRDLTNLQVQSARLAIEEQKLRLQGLRATLKAGGRKPISNALFIDAQKTLTSIPDQALAELNPLFNQEMVKSNISVLPIDPETGKTGIVPRTLTLTNWMFWGNRPARLRGAQAGDKAFFELDVFKALAAPWLPSSGITAEARGLVLPSPQNYGSPDAVEIALNSWEKAVGFRFLSIPNVPTEQKDVFTTLTRDQLKRMIIRANAQGGTLIRFLTEAAEFNPDLLTPSQAPFDPKDVGAVKEPEDDLPPSLQSRLDDLTNAINPATESEIEAELQRRAQAPQ